MSEIPRVVFEVFRHQTHVFVMADTVEEFIDKFTKAAKRILVDHPTEYKIDPFMGPLIDQLALEKFNQSILLGETNGAEILMENQQLKTEILLLKAQQQQLAKLELQVERLESLLGTTGKITNQTVQIATVTFYSSNPLSQFITLNKGSLDKIKKQQTVIDSLGIMGQIIQTTPTTSRVLLITDPDHQIPVRIQRTGQRGILNGTGHDNAKLSFIPANSEVKVGDIIESSGLGGVFPAGYPVAKITQIDTLGDNPYFNITAAPVARLNQSHKALIISQEEAEDWRKGLDFDLDFNLKTEEAIDKKEGTL